MMTAKKLSYLIILLTGILVGCEDTQPPETTPLRAVKFFEVDKALSQTVRSFSGVSKSEQEANLSFKISGTLQVLNIAVGDSIAPGQVIAEIDPSQFRLQAQQAQADLTRAIAERRNAESVYQTTRDLYENQSASKTDLDTARAASESAKAQVSVGQRALEIAQLNASYTQLVASQSCSVASVSVEVGENVSIGQEIVKVNCGDQLKVDVSVPENIIASINPGLNAQVSFDSLPNEVFSGSVTEVGTAAYGTTFPVSVRLKNPAGVRTGLAAQVRFELPTDTSIIVIPINSVSEDQSGQYVYLILPGSEQGKGIIKRQGVTVGNIVSQGIEVIDGLEPGDRVVSAGISVIREDLEVLLN